MHSVEVQLFKADAALGALIGAGMSVADLGKSDSSVRKRKYGEIEEDEEGEGIESVFKDVMRQWEYSGVKEVFKLVNDERFFRKLALNQDYRGVQTIMEVVVAYRHSSKVFNEHYARGDIPAMYDELTQNTEHLLYKNSQLIHCFNLTTS